uniref:Uncharacterized protein n=1 Tax=Hyaloperonospora arabidopsidis (strain Emoy2) TaxID=559515 RepID=M4BP68_HYAAE
MPLRRGLHIPYRVATINCILWGPASPGSPTIRFRAFMILREAKLSITGTPNGTFENYCKPEG